MKNMDSVLEGLGFGISGYYPSAMESQMKKKLESGMDSGGIKGV